MLSVELCNHHEVLLLPGHFQNDLLVLERLPDGLLLSPCLTESIHFPIWTGSSMKVLSGTNTLSNLEDLVHNPLILVRLRYHHSVLE